MNEAAEVIEEVIESTEPEKTLTQAEVDKIVADRVGRERRKFEKKYEGVDVDQFTKWQEQQAQSEVDQATAKGEFEKVIKMQAEKKDAEIAVLNKRLTNNEVDGAILRAAEVGQAVAPSQVTELLKGKVRLSSEGVAEVLDNDGTTRYGDDGSPLTVHQLVGEFLTTNPHFVKASQGGAGSTGSVGGNTHKAETDVEKMSDPEYIAYRDRIGRGSSKGGYIQHKS